MTKIMISKVDIAGEELPGAKLSILDSDGNVVKSWVSGKEPYYIEKLPIGEYILREESAPDGYFKAEDVKFTVEDTGEIQKVVMTDEAKPQSEEPEQPGTPSVNAPKTGDNSPILMWIGITLLSMGLLGVTLIKRKKNRGR